MSNDRSSVRLLVAGELRDTAGQLPVVNPATGAPVGDSPLAEADLVDEAVRAAHAAFRDWAALPVPARTAYLTRFAAWVRDHVDPIARTLTAEQGKPLSESIGEVKAVATAFDYYASAAPHVLGETIPTASPTLRSTVLRQPSGVVGAIATWNYPLGILAWKLAPALAAGCTVVAKPAEQTPLSTLALAEGFVAAGFPAGVVNLVAGPGATVGAALAAHPLVRHLTFTGGTGTGKTLMRVAADTLKRLTLELGGGSPLIVAADAPLERAVADGVKRAFRNSGQLCNSVQHIYVEAAVADEFTERFVTAAATMRIGRGDAAPEPDMGPMCGEAALQHVTDLVEDARAAGATVLTGGQRLTGPEYDGGWYFPPTVLTGVTDTMRISSEEVFGPVAVITVVSSVDEAIERANAGESGLVAFLYTTDLRTATLGAERLEYGTVNINNVGGGDVPFPYAGWKQSGLGVELARDGLTAFLETKHVRVELGY
ncbi:aldehyde dehydrogenase family protein [Planosporangium thailandense]|uniref:Aldehyde dehydrogenase family protein n=1 Tax=Planosporangium thailandense TaxID=765197 RepID=A0ABX0Y7K2_9ACTN|nr:aldehyde dehydrogenase family protein [Planosporangium thailandense]